MTFKELVYTCLDAIHKHGNDATVTFSMYEKAWKEWNGLLWPNGPKAMLVEHVDDNVRVQVNAKEVLDKL